MKIAVLSPVWFPVPPSGYGGIEWIVSLLADGLAEAGHDVTLFASGDSHTRAKLDAVFPKAPSELIGQTFWELQHALVLRAPRRLRRDPRPHGLLGLASAACCRHRSCTRSTGRSTGSPAPLRAVVRMAPNAKLISLSMNQRAPRPELPWIANVPNALDLSFYPFRPEHGRVPALHRPDERGQGRAPRGRGRAGDRPAAEDRRQVRRAGGAQYFDAYVEPAPRTTASTWAR